MAFIVTVMKERSRLVFKRNALSIKNSIDKNHFKITATGQTKVV